MDIPIFFYGTPSLIDRMVEHGGDVRLPMGQAFDLHKFPPLQIFEDEETLYVRACVPGVSLHELSLTLKGKVLRIEGCVPLPEGRRLRQERVCGPFKREVRLPCDVENVRTEAVIRDGLLTVTLPKNMKRNEKRAIHVEFAPGALGRGNKS